ncbi:MAG TPA: DUF1328 domain-containing protein [Rhizomicrobium sp.]|jgi:uncharacterized membrane protein YtjA (UPF0391 family)|nr:DUF1328 domain-containing protein [Rhizomicrobium sp.]
MLRWALIFLVIGLIAGVLGFTSVAGASIAIAKTLFFIFMVIFVVLLIAGLAIGRRVTGS